MKPSRISWLFLIYLCACSNAGTETGNPPTRDACAKVVCTPCAPPIVLLVTDADTGAPVEGLAIDGDAAACSVQASNTQCQLEGSPYTRPGPHTLELSAPGHETSTVEVEVGMQAPVLCCQCGYTPVRRDLTLAPLASSD